MQIKNKNFVQVAAWIFLGFVIGLSVGNYRKSKVNSAEKNLAQLNAEEEEVKNIPISSLSEEIIITKFGFVDFSKESTYNEWEVHNLEALRVVTGDKSTFHVPPKDLTNRWKLEIPSKNISIFLQEK